MAQVRALDVVADSQILPIERPRGSALGRFARKKPLGAAGGILVLLLVGTAVLADVLSTHDPVRTSTNVLVAPGADFWLGTDNLGRDLYSRIVHGSRISLLVGLASTVVGTIIVGLIGLISGYAGGKTDLLSQRVMDIMQALPILVLALVLAAALGPSLPNAIVAISIPITMGPFIVLATAQLGGSILVEAALSFLGLGIPEPYPSWGRMLSIAAAEYAERAPWLVIWPGLAISLAVFGTNLLGDALRDTLDPRLRGS
ncbi:MAG: ABC transporter permease [Candidatus Rokuibacteriota bacterium]|nr:MAG: ABC transporter permease [Candidatus Rokubacteria bacterium]